MKNICLGFMPNLQLKYIHNSRLTILTITQNSISNITLTMLRILLVTVLQELTDYMLIKFVYNRSPRKVNKQLLMKQSDAISTSRPQTPDKTFFSESIRPWCRFVWLTYQVSLKSDQYFTNWLVEQIHTCFYYRRW